MLRLPNNVLQKALIKLLKEKINPLIGVHDFVPANARIPYITIGNIVTHDTSTKTEDNTRLEIQINIWSTYKGKYEINRIAENIINLLTSEEGYLNVEDSGFKVYEQTINMYEAFPEDNTGYNGVINLEVKVKNLQATADDI